MVASKIQGEESPVKIKGMKEIKKNPQIRSGTLLEVFRRIACTCKTNTTVKPENNHQIANKRNISLIVSIVSPVATNNGKIADSENAPRDKEIVD